VLCNELDTAPAILCLMLASASIKQLTVDPVPTPTTVPGTTKSNAARPTKALSSSWVMGWVGEAVWDNRSIMAFIFVALAGGTPPLLASLGWCVACGAGAAALLRAVRRDRAPDQAITVRGPVSYAGPGSLGGVDSARRR
jgi:hypothetical protein